MKQFTSKNSVSVAGVTTHETKSFQKEWTTRATGKHLLDHQRISSQIAQIEIHT